jgi:hypothetical protein
MLNVALLTDKNNPPDTTQDTEKKDTNFEWIYILWVFLGVIGLCIICWGIDHLFSMWNRYKEQQEKQKNMIY